MAIPDWKLPPGVDRGLWDYLHSGEMVANYDEQMAASPLAAADVRFCEASFPRPGRLIDLGCGTGRLCLHFAAKGYGCVGVDLSDEMLTKARANADPAGVSVEWVRGNLVDLAGIAGGSFDYAACLFSTLGMVRGAANRGAVLRSAFRVLRPGGVFVLHVHNRWFRGLGWKRVFGHAMRAALGKADAGDVTMPQAYAGASLTLHHFTRGETEGLIREAGFVVRQVTPMSVTGLTPTTRFGTYGYLVLGEKPVG
jgi:SAM-dependent methyltransferase